MSKLRLASAVMALLFVTCVVLQYNDPDPLPWMTVYGAAAILSVVHARRRRVAPAFPLGVAAVALAWGVWIAAEIDGSFEWFRLGQSMQAGTPQIEQSRESLGLFVIAAWMLVVAAAARREPAPG